MPGKPTIIHWFRKGLRVHDNPSLSAATEIIEQYPENYVFRPIFVLDPGIVKWLKVGPNRWRFLVESLEQLNESLLSINTRLYVVRGNPKDVFPKLFNEWNVKIMTFESDIEPYAKERDNLIKSLARKSNVNVIEMVGHTIYDPHEVLKKNNGLPIITYQKFLSVVATIKAGTPIGTPKPLDDSSTPKLDKSEKLKKNCYDIPTLKELKVDEESLGPNLYPGGEAEGLKRMKMHLKRTDWICKFEKPNTSPNSLEPSTTVLSPYFKFGCLSSRLFYERLCQILSKNSKHSKPPVSLVGQMMWREFYYAAGAGEPLFDRMKGNSICRQIPWEKNTKHLDAWTFGKTGYPFIDAIMRQLRQEGWIHHLARHAVACFLTRGDLWISWEEGQLVFEELLLDADWALNAGNWMWLSASAFFHQFFRVYSPVSFGKKTDPRGEYIIKYVPELKNYPTGLLYEPWKATLSDQKKFGCVLGKEYPHRIVIHEDVYKVNIKRMSEAYKMNREMAEKPEASGSSSIKRKKNNQASIENFVIKKKKE